MPPKKRRGQRAQKPQLLFHEQPLEGPKHHYEPSQRPMVTHTVQVPTKSIDQSSITSWVSPQFDTKKSQLPIRQKRGRYQTRHSTRKSTSKFPCLAFESPGSSSSEPLRTSIKACPDQSEKGTPRRPLVPMFSPQSGEASVHALCSLPHAFLPPDIETPDSSVREDAPPPDQKENSLSDCILRPQSPSSPEPGPVLVKDTPEEKYGLKVTWRRRKHLFAYLKERGKLSRTQFQVTI